MEWRIFEEEEPAIGQWITVPTEFGGIATARYLGNRNIGEPGEAIEAFRHELHVVTRWIPA